MNITKREDQHIEECLDEIQAFTDYIENASDDFIFAERDWDFVKGMIEAFEYMIGLTTETNIRDVLEARCEATMQNLRDSDIDYSSLSNKSLLKDRLIRAKRYTKSLENKIENDDLHLVAPDMQYHPESMFSKESMSKFHGMIDDLKSSIRPLEVK